MGCFSLARADQAGITLADVYVVPEHRGKAVGRTMINYVLARCDAVKLHCEAQHISFYEKFGFDVRTNFVIKGADGAEKTMYVMHFSRKQDICHLHDNDNRHCLYHIDSMDLVSI